MATANPRVTLGAEQQFIAFFDRIISEIETDIAECIGRKIPGAINWAAIRTLYAQRRRLTQAVRHDPDFPHKTGMLRKAVRNQIRTLNPTKRPGRDTAWGARITLGIATKPNKKNDGFVSSGQRAKMLPRFEAIVDKIRDDREPGLIALFEQNFNKIWQIEIEKCFNKLDKVTRTKIRL